MAYHLLLYVPMLRLSTRDFLRYLALPCLVYSVMFFGASELIEYWLFLRVDEVTIHFLHFLRGVLSVFFVAAVVSYVLSRAQRTFSSQMETVCSLLNAADEGLIALDSGWNVVSLNTRATELLGSIHSGNFSQWLQRIRHLLQKQSEFESSSPDSTAKLRILALQSQEGGYLLLLQDITERKKIEEQWLIAEKMVSVGRMAAGLAHEIGTPLNIISGRAELIQSMQSTVCQQCQAKPVCPVDKHIMVIFQQIDRISRIINQLLAQAREPASQRGAFSLSDTVTKVVQLLQPYLDKRNVQIRVDLGENLPPLYGLSDQFQQVLINLLMNSIDAVEGKQGAIEVGTAALNGEVQLRVRDNGCGIAEENLIRIFDPFFTTKEFGKGTGLGLTVTSNIIRAHGGTIEVESVPERGTEFTIYLPVHLETTKPLDYLENGRHR